MQFCDTTEGCLKTISAGLVMLNMIHFFSVQELLELVVNFVGHSDLQHPHATMLFLKTLFSHLKVNMRDVPLQWAEMFGKNFRKVS